MSVNKSTTQSVPANNQMKRENKNDMVGVAEDHCNKKGNKCYVKASSKLRYDTRDKFLYGIALFVKLDYVQRKAFKLFYVCTASIW